MGKPGIAVTIRSFGSGGRAPGRLRDRASILFCNTSGRRLTEDGLIRALQGAEGVIAGTEPFTRRVLESSPSLRAISRVGSGTDSIDLAAARERGIAVLVTRDAPVHAVAEHTLAIMLACLKQIPRRDRAMRDGKEIGDPGGMLEGRSVGIIGLGRIGRQVVRLLEPFGCRILYHDIAPPPETGPAWERKELLRDLLAQSDIVSLHATAPASGKPILDEEAFHSIKPGVIIINTARGSLIDEDALLRAIRNGTVAGAGLDVFQSEPYRGPLLACPQVIATPHVASNTVESRAAMEDEAVEHLLSALEGRGR
ncbi:MAG: phosphoglycerate dehydrogenase [Methanomicrobiales archaeon]|nr:phosphoglycerate dehydrogenase [Methanomicrobiales archaeon]MDD1655578.1 phosphoglycerate dehydrogenase [Methanomicrobiales archaeon]